MARSQPGATRKSETTATMPRRTAARRVAVGVRRRGQRLALGGPAGDVRHVAAGARRLPAGVIVVAPIQAQLGAVRVGRIGGHRGPLQVLRRDESWKRPLAEVNA